MTLKSKTVDTSTSVGVPAKKVVAAAGLGGGILAGAAQTFGVRCEERKIAPSMIVSVPRKAVTLSVGLMTIQSSASVLHPVVQCQSTEETSTMLVSFPISAFMQRKITSVDVLLSRLEKISLPSM